MAFALLQDAGNAEAPESEFVKALTTRVLSISIRVSVIQDSKLEV